MEKNLCQHSNVKLRFPYFLQARPMDEMGMRFVDTIYLASDPIQIGDVLLLIDGKYHVLEPLVDERPAKGDYSFTEEKPMWRRWKCLFIPPAQVLEPKPE